MAKNEGLTPLVIDCFADIDTQKTALETIKVEDLSTTQVKKAISILSKQYRITHVIYGSGLENQQNTLKYLEQNFVVIGNSSSVFAAVHDKAYFFKKLKQLNITYPETTFQQPDNQNNWLIKPLNGEGGIGIKWMTDKSSRCYWQKHCVGTANSVLFIANGTHYKIIDFHKQFVSQINEQPFVFSGVINQPEINNTIVQVMQKILNKLVIEFSLKGLNSLDFIENNNQCYVLEINARLSASLNLYNSALISAHIKNQVETETLALPPDNPELYRAYRIIFAKKNITINKPVIWPEWVSDIPQKGSIINTGNPICSIIAGGKNEQQTESLLLLRKQQLMKLIT